MEESPSHTRGFDGISDCCRGQIQAYFESRLLLVSRALSVVPCIWNAPLMNTSALDNDFVRHHYLLFLVYRKLDWGLRW